MERDKYRILRILNSHISEALGSINADFFPELHSSNKSMFVFRSVSGTETKTETEIEAKIIALPFVNDLSGSYCKQLVFPSFRKSN